MTEEGNKRLGITIQKKVGSKWYIVKWSQKYEGYSFSHHSSSHLSNTYLLASTTCQGLLRVKNK